MRRHEDERYEPKLNIPAPLAGDHGDQLISVVLRLYGIERYKNGT